MALKTFLRLYFLPMFVILLVTQVSFCQYKVVKTKAVPQKADSCHLTIYNVVTKEMSRSASDIKEEKIKQITLSYPDMTTLEKILSKKPSYTNERALLTHHNLIFDFFKKGKVVNKVYVSTITGNINIDNLANKTKWYKRVSPKLGADLLWLLDKNHLTQLIPAHNLKGLTSERKK